MNINELTLETIGSWPMMARGILVAFVNVIIFLLFYMFNVKPMHLKYVRAITEGNDLHASYQVKYSHVVNRNPAPPVIKNQQFRPDSSHAISPLESFPLTQLRYVGMLSQPNQTWGLIRIPDGTLYNIAIGEYIGNNYGKVITITLQKMIVQETVPDGLGGWVKRIKELPITSGKQENAQS